MDIKIIQFPAMKYERINCFLIDGTLIGNPLPVVIFEYLCMKHFDMIQKQIRDNFLSYPA